MECWAGYIRTIIIISDPAYCLVLYCPPLLWLGSSTQSCPAPVCLWQGSGSHLTDCTAVHRLNIKHTDTTTTPPPQHHHTSHHLISSHTLHFGPWLHSHTSWTSWSYIIQCWTIWLKTMIGGLWLVSMGVFTKNIVGGLWPAIAVYILTPREIDMILYAWFHHMNAKIIRQQTIHLLYTPLSLCMVLY